VGQIKERSGALDAMLRERGWSIYSLSRKSGVSEATIRKLCNGDGPCRMNTVRKLCAALDMEASELSAILQGDGIVVGAQAS
jgi:DNA-binding Xre family transcriptional regulator